MSICKSDFHIHLDDYLNSQGRWKKTSIENRRHGMTEEDAARGIIKNQINLAGLVTHDSITPQIFNVREEVERIIEEEDHNNFKPKLLLGSEITVQDPNSDMTHHVVVIFKDEFTPYNIPKFTPIRGIKTQLTEIERIEAEFDCITYVAHPELAVKTIDDALKVVNFIKNPVFDGYEIFNGALYQKVLTNNEVTHPRESKQRRYRKAFQSQVFLHGIIYDKARGNIRFGNSDAHRPNILGSAFTTFPSYFDDPLSSFDHARTNHTLSASLKDTRSFNLVFNTILEARKEQSKKPPKKTKKAEQRRYMKPR